MERGKKSLEQWCIENNIDALKYWDYESNRGLLPSSIPFGSAAKIWCKDEFGHQWLSDANRLRAGVGCPYCSGNKVLIGFNDLSTTHPQIAEMWDTDHNGNLSPTMFSKGSTQKVWWKCENGHNYEMRIYSRTGGSGCPYCSGRKALPGFSDLETMDFEIASEWHPTKNGNLKPSDVAYGSHQKVWWLGKCGHEWQAVVNNRRRMRGCPICSNKIVVKECNSLMYLNPKLASEWHPTKNGDLKPSDVTSKSSKNVWWLGKCGHEWKSKVCDRSRGSGCPICRREYSTSFNEKAIAFYLEKIVSIEVNSHPLKSNRELDIFIPELKIAIEYDGDAFHNDVEKDLEKHTECSEQGIRLIRIREPNCPIIVGCESIILKTKHTSEIEQMLNTILNMVAAINNAPIPDVNLERDRIQIYELFIKNRKNHSLYEQYPDVASEWHTEKNGYIRTEYVMSNSNRKFWWICDKGHEWQATVASRTSGRGCPICSGRKVLPGYNDFLTTNPELQKYLHPTKNADVDLSTLSYGSKKKIWWVCEKGHPFESSLHRFSKTMTCPICSGHKVLAGYNDLATTHPEIAASWDYELNGDLKPTMVSKGSNRKVSWRCDVGHKWCSSINARDTPFCPICREWVKPFFQK